MTEIKTVLQDYQNREREYLIPILQDIQSLIGFISPDAIAAVALHLKIPTSKVYAVASFYDQFKFLPFAKYRIKVCNGTGCHIEGSGAIYDELVKLLGNAPVIKINDKFYIAVTLEMAADIIKSIKALEDAP